ncbi:MAG: enoyl-CoA hydratase [Alphaproteobacteria bacterium]|nr:enoyl-CoA hydratase [Alphaproteobacteria bacterium]
MVLLVDKKDGVATVTLNRPEAMNALSMQLRGAIADAFEALTADDEVRVIIVTGAGERAFTAGLDLKELGSNASALGSAGHQGGALKDPVKAMAACPKPIIAAVNGVAITGGFELALACDVLIASTNARFADTHGRVGIIPGWGLSQKLARAVGVSRAKELSLTGNFIDAKTACEWGLVNRVYAPDELMPAALKLAHDMASVPKTMSETYKKLIDDGFNATLGEAMKLEAETSRQANRAVKPEDVEARRAGIQARARTQ